MLLSTAPHILRSFAMRDPACCAGWTRAQAAFERLAQLQQASPTAAGPDPQLPYYAPREITPRHRPRLMSVTSLRDVHGGGRGAEYDGDQLAVGKRVARPPSRAALAEQSAVWDDSADAIDAATSEEEGEGEVSVEV